jgi:arylsulfatase A-like enzyme
MKVLVVNACALHLGYIGCYGNEWIETPNLDRLAAEGVVFDQHYADNPGASTRSCGRACLTGRYQLPVPADADSRGESDTMPPDFSLENLSSAQFRLIDSGRVGFSDREEVPRWEQTFQAALSGLDQLAAKDRWLIWVDLPSLAPPWQVPDEFLERCFPRGAAEEEEPLTPWLDPPSGPLDTADATDLERLQNTYAAVVTFFDDQLGRLLEGLDELGLKEQVLVCVTSAKGLALGEHSMIGEFQPWLHDEVIHLPLLVRLPGGAEAGRRVAALTQPVDLPPTFLEALDVPIPPGLHGQSLWPLLRGEKEQVRAYACSGWRMGEQTEWALRTPEWAFLLPQGWPSGEPHRKPQLYVKPDDRWEVNNVIQHHLELAEHLEETLMAFVRAAAQPGPLQERQVKPPIF